MRDEFHFYVEINIKLSYKLIPSILMDMTQITYNNNFAKSLQYLKFGQVCWLSRVIRIIFFICQSKTITNDYFHFKNERRDRGSSNVLLLLSILLLLLLLLWFFLFVLLFFFFWQNFAACNNFSIDIAIHNDSRHSWIVFELLAEYCKCFVALFYRYQVLNWFHW